MLAEVNETIENAKNVVNVVALPPEAKDSGSQESDVEDVADNMEEIFSQLGNLKWRKTLRVMKNQKRLYHQTRRKNFRNGKKIYKFDKTILLMTTAQNSFKNRNVDVLNIAVIGLFILLSGMTIQL